MKPTLSFLFVICLFTTTLNAQFELIPSGTGATLYDVDFPSDQVGFAVGDSGVVLKTIDGGNSWSRTNLGDYKIFYGVEFINNTKGFAVGHSYQPSSGLVYSTTDGGVNWTPITGFEQADLKEVFFIDAQTGFVTGMQDGLGVIFKTTDGGQSWAETEIQADLPSPVNDIHFPTADIGYAATRGAVLKSEDQGDNWYIVAQVDIDDPAVFPFSIIEAIYFSDENHGIFGGWYSAALCTSTDGGQSWNAYDGLTIEIFSIDFPTASVGYAFGTNVNSYLKTTDGGANWELLDFPPSLPSGGSYYGAHFAAEDIGLIVGTSGLILKMGEFPVSTNEPGTSTNGSLIFPNPAQTEIQWKLDTETTAGATLQIFDSAGRLLCTKRFPARSSYTLDLGNFPDGHYFYHLTREQQAALTGLFQVQR